MSTFVQKRVFVSELVNGDYIELADASVIRVSNAFPVGEPFIDRNNVEDYVHAVVYAPTGGPSKLRLLYRGQLTVELLGEVEHGPLLVPRTRGADPTETVCLCGWSPFGPGHRLDEAPALLAEHFDKVARR